MKEFHRESKTEVENEKFDFYWNDTVSKQDRDIVAMAH